MGHDLGVELRGAMGPLWRVHQHLMSGRAAAAALYPPALCKAICRGLAKQRSYDNSGLAGGQRFGRKEFEAVLKKPDNINNDIEDIDKLDDADPGNRCTDDVADKGDGTPTDGSQEASSHMADEPGRDKTHETCCVHGRDWTDKKHEPDGTSPEHIDRDVNHDLDDNDEDAEEIEDQYFRMNITDATAKIAMLKAARVRARTNTDKHRETRVRRAELRSISKGHSRILQDRRQQRRKPFAHGHVRSPPGSWCRRRVGGASQG